MGRGLVAQLTSTRSEGCVAPRPCRPGRHIAPPNEPADSKKQKILMNLHADISSMASESYMLARLVCIAP
jgi:hypothetical protein